MAQAMPYLLLATTAYGVYSQVQAGKDAADLAKYNSNQIKAETAEKVRRQEAEDLRREAAANAIAHGRGVRVSGSVSKYLDEMQRENDANIDWLKRSGASQAYVARKEGSTAKKQAYAGAVQTLATGAMGVYTAGANPKVGWWG